MSFSIREKYFICPFKINGQTSVGTLVFMTLVGVFSLQVIFQPVFALGFSKIFVSLFSTISPWFFSQIKYYPFPSESPCFVSLLLLLPSEWDGSGGEYVHCTENVRPLFWTWQTKLALSGGVFGNITVPKITLSNFLDMYVKLITLIAS